MRGLAGRLDGRGVGFVAASVMASSLADGRGQTERILCVPAHRGQPRVPFETTRTRPSPSAAAPSRFRWPSPTRHDPEKRPLRVGILGVDAEVRPLRVAILGAGTVGAEVARGFLHSPNRQIGPAGGRMLELVAIADMNVEGAWTAACRAS